jgi:NADH-quinone oxidoreductase subunit I
MIGQGLAAGLLITLSHFGRSLAGVVRPPRRSGQAVHQTPIATEKGIFTVQYPEEKLALPERFRYIPMLIVDDATGKERCTSCGICAKVCPPQCIWIVRSSGPDGKPIPQPEEFYIDSSICMSCGLCAEYCPFDAIKMNHVYELATYERGETLLLRKKDLLVPASYHAKLHPTDFAVEEAERKVKEEADRQKAAAREVRPIRPIKPETATG